MAGTIRAIPARRPARRAHRRRRRGHALRVVARRRRVAVRPGRGEQHGRPTLNLAASLHFESRQRLFPRRGDFFVFPRLPFRHHIRDVLP